MLKLEFFEAFGYTDLTEYSLVVPPKYYKTGVQISYSYFLETNIAAWLKEEDCVYH